MNKQKLVTISIVFIAMFVVYNVLNTSATIETIEESVLDIKFRTFQREVPNEDIALVLIDQQSLDSLQHIANIYWPWPREIYSYVHNYLTAREATVIAYDILFDQPDFDRPGFLGQQSDRRFEGSIGIYQNAILSVFMNPSTEIGVNNLTRKSVNVQGLKSTEYFKPSNIPIDMFLNASSGLGSVTMLKNDESVIRSAHLFFQMNENEWIPSLAMSALLTSTQQAAIKYIDGEVQMDGLSIPLNNEGKYYINWYKKGGGGLDQGTFKNYSFASVLSEAITYAETGEIPSNSVLDVEGKAIFIGANAAGLADIKSTPMSILEPFPGVEIHATVYQNLISNDHLRQVSSLDFLFYGPIILVALLLVLLVFSSDYRINIPISIVLFGGIIILGLYTFSEHRIWFPTVQATLFIGLSLMLTYISKYVTEDLQKKRLRLVFSRYVQKELVHKIAANSELIKLGGERKKLSILFTDLAGFTGISEQAEPEELVEYLNEYLSIMTEVVFKHQGTLDKYIGDAIMAFWGAPMEDEDHAVNACKCILEMEEELAKLQIKWMNEGKPKPIVRFGLNTGEVVVGNIGSEERFDYTVLGDHVNLAARLEPANKEFGTYVLISENTYDLVKDAFICRNVGKLKVKGKSKSVAVYELLTGKDSNDASEKNEFANEFEHALELFYSKKFDEASTLFFKFRKKYTGDEVVETYLKKISHYQAFPPPEDWDGVHEQLNK